MNRTLKLLLLVTCLGGLSMIVCKDNPGSSGPSPEPIMFDDYVFFDTSLLIIQRSTSAGRGTEWYLACENSLGEPFTDVNGNGVYDPGIDIFVMSVGPDNMDYNNNGKHDGPNDPWEPGIPFDDHNGDGERSCDLEWHRPPHYYENWMPFCDMNGNGQWDSTSDLGYSVVSWDVKSDDTNEVEYQLVYDDSLFLYTSDSSVQYWQPESPIYHNPNRRVNFIVDDSGLIGISQSNHLRLLYYGNNTTDTIHVPYSTPSCPSASFRRSVQSGQSLEIAGTLHQDLLLVRFDDPQGDSGQVAYCTYHLWEYYFAEAAGLIAFHYEYGSNSEAWYYFDQQFAGAQPMMNSVIGCQPGRTEDHAHASANR